VKELKQELLEQEIWNAVGAVTLPYFGLYPDRFDFKSLKLNNFLLRSEMVSTWKTIVEYFVKNYQNFIAHAFLEGDNRSPFKTLYWR
jgi:hypothetical protein